MTSSRPQVAPRIRALYEFDPDNKLIVAPSFTTVVLNTPALTDTTVIVLYPYRGLIIGPIITASANHDALITSCAVS